ncbi:16S rRNA (cytosine(1402)-N(4))-methyltransferase RsmH [Pectinatus sottacetonis]|uniref:16S rRNA (cytosine(1402)-N(4))-methyltransferase RsmH n=1 Tax=Pectinatus sottacetonis TaxID=1002795 RepID=UPI0018C7C2BF
MEFHHISVMSDEVINGLRINPDGIYVDCTLGGAGHSSRIAKKLSARGILLGIDQDQEAVKAARERLAKYKCNIRIVHDNFKNLATIFKQEGITGIDGVLFDLGVSSPQIDNAERGFSYMHSAVLDMRMDTDAVLTAYDVVNNYSREHLTEIFKTYGEERWAKRIASFIEEKRKEAPIKTTDELVRLVCCAIPAAVRRKSQGHPAKRVFQAIRIEVNNELGILKDAFECAVDYLNPQGRIAIITFHSLEDRIAKTTLRFMARGCVCPPQLPVCICGHKKQIKLCGKAVKPSIEELENNPRARSAKLRIAEKL